MALRRRVFMGAVCFAIALIALMPAAAAAAEQIVCGKILGSISPQANAAGSFVVPQPGDTAPAGTYIVIPAGTQFSYAQPLVWVCVRTIDSPPTPVMGTQISSLTFLSFVQAGSPGYRAEPIPAPRASDLPRPVGGLPSTSTSPAGTFLLPVALFVSVLLALGAAYVLRRACGGALNGVGKALQQLL
jgi:hypothetical protein